MVPTATPFSLRSLLWVACLVFSPFLLQAQTPLLTDAGTTYLDTDGVVSDSYGPVDVTNCTSVAFTFSWAFTQPWEGAADLESSAECGACVGDPGMPLGMGCNNCWDFLNIEFLIDGTVVSSELIGESGTTDAEQSGTYTDILCTDGLLAMTASIQVQSQTWDVGEGVTYSNITIVCYEGAPSVSASPDPVCASGPLSLDGVVLDPGVLQSSTWIGAGTIVDPTELRTTVTDIPGPNQTYTLEVTDVNNCMASTNVNVDVTELIANPTDDLVICVDRQAGQGEVLNQADVEDQLAGGDPSLIIAYYFDAAGTDPIDLMDPASVRRLVESMQTTIFATVSDGTCESATVPINIDAVAYPQPNDELFVQCADEFGFADFDLDFITPRFNFTMPEWSVSYHETEDDARNDVNPITDILTLDGNQTVYARVFLSNGCAGVAEVRLRIEDPPAAAPAVLSRCDEGGMRATFDLEQALADINVDDIGYVVFYTSPAASTASVIANRNNFTTPTTTVYARVFSDNNCPSELVELELIVVSLDASQFSLEVSPAEACGSAEVELIVNGPGLPAGDFIYNISYGPESAFPLRTEDLPGSSGSVILQVEAFETYLFTLNSVVSPAPSSCPLFLNSTPFAIATINQGPPAYSTTIRACEFEFGQGVFDLTSLEDTIVRGQDYIELRFFEDEFLENQIFNPINYQSFPGLIYAAFEDPSGCFSEPAEIELFVDLVPEPIDFALDITENCGPTITNLSFTLPANQPLDFNFTLTTPGGSRDTTLENITRDSLIGIFVNDTTTFTLVSITNVNGCTFGFEREPVDTVNIRPNELIATPTSLALCDESGDSSQEAVFDLTTAEGTIRGGSGAPVRWFRDAATSQPITNTMSFLATNGTRVYAILDGPCPSPPVPIDLIVNTNPSVSISLEQPISCASALDAILQTTVNNGTGPFTYDWSNNAWDGQSRVTGVGSGVFQLQLVDANGCRGNASITVTAPAEVNLSCSVLANVSLVGADDGQGGYTLSGGSPPYNYQLTGPTPLNGTNAAPGSYTLDNLAAGDYTLVITDSRGCRAECSFTISNPGCDLSLAIAGTRLTCNGAADGSIDLTITSSFTVVSIDWNDDTYDGVEDPQNLVAGNYTVRVTDENGCTANTSINITQPPALVVDCSNTTNASATGAADGSLAAAISGGTAPYELVWNGPVSGSRDDDPDGSMPLTGLSAGDYSLDITDANGCSARCEFTINEPGCDLAIACTPNGVGEAEGPGSYTYTITGGTAPYRVVRTGPAPEVVDPLNVAGPQSTGLIPTGDYQITITDANGCTAQCSFRNVNCDLLLNCMPNGMGEGNGPGSYTFTFSGGTAGYELDLSGPGNFSTTRASATPYLSPVLEPGDWTFTIVDADGCSQSCNFTIDSPCELTVDLEPTDPSCSSGLDGAINVVLGNGTAPYTFDWSDDQYDSSGATALLTNLPAGTYAVTVTDANGCEAMASLSLTDPPAYQTNCAGDVFPSSPTATDGEIVITITAGPGGPYTISYDNGMGSSGSQAANLGPNRITALANGTYDITISNAAGCSTTCQLDLFFGACTFALTPSVSGESCAGANDGVILIESATGQAPYTYSWSNMGSGSLQTNLAPGNYTVTVTDANTCTVIASFTVNPGRALPTASFAAGGTICTDACFDLDISLSGTPGFSLAYEWVLPGQRIAGDFNTTELNPSLPICPADEALPAGDFLLLFSSVSDDRCSQDLTDTLRFTYQALATMDLSPQLCLSDSLVVGGQTFNAARPNGQVVLPGAAQAGCDSIVNVALSFFDPVRTDISPEICTGGSVQIGTVVFDESNPTGSVNLTTINGCDSLVNVSLQVVDIVTTNLQPVLCPGQTLMVGDSVLRQAGTYAIEFPAGAVSGCDSLVNVDLSFYAPAAGNLTATLCPGESRTVGNEVFNEARPTGDVVLPDASAQGCDSLVQVSLSFFAPDTARVEPLLCLGQAVTVGAETFDENRPSGFVILPAATANGCDSLVSVSLSYRPQATGSLDTVLCFGGSLQVGNTLFDADNPNGQVLLLGASAAGCDSLVNVSTSYVTELTVSMPDDVVFCGDDPASIEIDLSAGGVYNLTFGRSGGGSITELAVIPPGLSLDLGVLTQSETITLLSASSTNNCPVNIVDNQTEISYSDTRLRLLSIGGNNGLDLSCADAEDGAIAVEVEGGVGPFTYRWSTGASSAVLNDLGAGAYSVSVTDQSGCTVSEALSLQAPLPLTAALSSQSVGCFGTAAGLIQIDTIVGGTGAYSYQLQDGSGDEVRDFPVLLSNLNSGSYTVQLSDANGCTLDETIGVPAANELIVRLGPDTTITLGQTIDLDPLLSFEPVSWQWTPAFGLSADSILRPQAAPQETVEYVLTVVDEFGCTTSDAIRVTVNQEIPIFIPNAFSPNGDERNDELLIFGSDAVEEIETFIVFDRWGSQVYEVAGFGPNDVNAAWDGTYRGEPLNAGVFLYLVKYRLVNGDVLQQAGEVLLLR